MIIAAALTAVKYRLDILNTDTTFDAQLTDYINQAVNRLYPRTGVEVAAQTANLTVDTYGEGTVDLSALSTPVTDVRFVEVTEGYAMYPADSKMVHGTILRLRDLPTSVTQVKIWGLNSFTLATVPASLELAIYWYAMSEFYENLAGNKRKFNIYMQTTGVSAMQEMRQEALFYEQKADAYVDEQAPVYGSQ
jgi:hypothetical protein